MTKPKDNRVGNDLNVGDLIWYNPNREEFNEQNGVRNAVPGHYRITHVHRTNKTYPYKTVFHDVYKPDKDSYYQEYLDSRDDKKTFDFRYSNFWSRLSDLEKPHYITRYDIVGVEKVTLSDGQEVTVRMLFLSSFDKGFAEYVVSLPESDGEYDPLLSSLQPTSRLANLEIVETEVLDHTIPDGDGGGDGEGEPGEGDQESEGGSGDESDDEQESSEGEGDQEPEPGDDQNGAQGEMYKDEVEFAEGEGDGGHQPDSDDPEYIDTDQHPFDCDCYKCELAERAGHR